MNVNNGINIILGGNGLGKTTIMQAIVYALTGGAQQIEDDKRQRWDNKYFRTRLDQNHHADALVEVDFRLGDTSIGVRRGVIGSGVVGCRVGSEATWIEQGGDPALALERAIIQHGRYRKILDFYFIIHRLLYLSESRRSLIWDTTAQVRAIMLFCPELIDEDAFRKRRAELKELDSKKRHLHVAVGHAEKQLAEAAEDEIVSEVIIESASETDKTIDNLDNHLSELNQVREQMNSLREGIRELSDQLTERSTQVEQLRIEIEHIEAAIISNSIRNHEKKDNLAVHSLVQHGNCPSCGMTNDDLQQLAKQRIQKNCCAICGTLQPALTDINSSKLDTLRSQLGEKLRAQANLAARLKQVTARVDSLEKKEQILDSALSKARSLQTAHIRALLERRVPLGTSPQQLSAMKDQLAIEEKDSEAQLLHNQENLRREYARFSEAVHGRIEDLKKLYHGYATAYLGFACDMVESPSKDRLFQLNGFVPRFNDKLRHDGNSCSEAQRFFLDIAFRMALIDFNKKYAGHAGSFLCETPESALDISYLDNVVEMFFTFSKQKHKILLTANIQNEGLAEKQLHRYSIVDRPKRLLNLLNYGQLSSVHQAAKTTLDASVRRSLKR